MCLYIRVSSLKSKPYKGSDKPRAMSVLFFPSNREDNEVQGKFPLTEVCLQSIAFFFFFQAAIYHSRSICIFVTWSFSKKLTKNNIERLLLKWPK